MENLIQILEQNDELIEDYSDDEFIPLVSNEYYLSQSQRGKDIIHHEFHSYSQATYNGSSEGLNIEGFINTLNNLRFVCTNKNCIGRINLNMHTNITTGEKEYFNFEIISQHTCESNGINHILHLQAERNILNLVRSGISLSEAYNTIIVNGSEAMQIVNPRAAATFRTEMSLRSAAARIQVSRFPISPASPNNIIFPDNWKNQDRDRDFDPLTNKKFLLINSTHILDNGRIDSILVFGTEEALGRLCSADVWQIDATFKTCPKPFAHLFTFHIFIGNRAVTCLYCLLCSKRSYTYERLFHLIISKAAQLNHQIAPVKTIIGDFEASIKIAVRTVWPQFVYEGFYFHFCQAIYKRIQGLHLRVKL
jgi:hypothetical protein